MRVRRPARTCPVALVGICGPRGAGKTALIEQLILRLMARGTEVAVITDGRSRSPGAVSLRRSAWIPPERVASLRSSAAGEKEAATMARAADEMAERIPGLELILIEQHGRSTPDVALDYRLRVIESEPRYGEDRRRGAAESCDLLVVNKTDLIPALRRDRDAGAVGGEGKRARGGAAASKVVAASCATGIGVDQVVSLIVNEVLGRHRAVAQARPK